MSDRNAFYQAIWAAPDDDLPRMVFADWLDEHDDPDAAAFLRLLCACRTCPPDVDQLRPLVAELRRTMVKLPPEFIESACPVHPTVVIGPWVDVDHEANRKVLEWLQANRQRVRGIRSTIDVTLPHHGTVSARSWEVEQLWDKLIHSVSPGAGCSVEGFPCLVDVWSGVLVAIVYDRRRFAIRIPTENSSSDYSRPPWDPTDRILRPNLPIAMSGTVWVVGNGTLREYSWLTRATEFFDPANRST